ncbi:hypothetical protein ASPVEDRAFT_33458 [Aspergillus versicolor CBS 583.65]|uniref:Uncharacterized protein n=1 Tax=Aspergillus versicolor CBS 583.65 TaxID=1036611 RepID=A0A1L9Q0C3_ASPVE|nr:uncharacterized protein ASPVEDRAFT_33458 [Aspergillus versicolor CBS 583.65]OJJ07227.1 hypothetical protein ASPVEDRAFT_33458 [Aspergillus versicolor CBS 583.65]
MKISAASASVLLAAIAPAVVGQWIPPGTLALIGITTSTGTQFTAPGLKACEESPFGVPFNAKEIDIKSTGAPAKCTFYSEGGCKGQHYTLKDGFHPLRHDLVVGSFNCALA